GTMRVTEQLDALQMLRTNATDYLVLPRVVACCLVVPILTTFGAVIGVTGGMAIADLLYGQPPNIFINYVRLFLETRDLIAVLLKAGIFGGLVAVIGCGWGLTTRGGAKGVGQASTAAVVTAWIFIFMTDFCLSLLIFGRLST
ncbi:MAG: ABC transporter permease, partial [Cyanobacteria bacterium P01_H01_bin.121]